MDDFGTRGLISSYSQPLVALIPTARPIDNPEGGAAVKLAAMRAHLPRCSGRRKLMLGSLIGSPRLQARARIVSFDGMPNALVSRVRSR